MRRAEEWSRSFTAEQRQKLASEGKALSDGSYPIESAQDIPDALTLARSGHGNVSAAMSLIRKRAKELGVKLPGSESSAAPQEKTCPTCDGSGKVPAGY